MEGASYYSQTTHKKMTERSMKNYVSLALVVLAVGVFAHAQTSNSKYEVTLFGAPPVGQNVWNLPRSVAVDGKGTVYLLRASDPPVLIFNREGKLQKTWGSGLFKEAHSIDLDRDGFLWITDREDNMVFKFTVDGKQILSIGKKGVKGDNTSQDTFNGSSDVAVAQNGDFFVADGQGGNSRVVKFSKDGKFMKIIGGTKGSGPGQFDVPHALALDSKGRLLVVDEQPTAKKPRVQIFDQNGTFIEEWASIGLKQPTGITVAADDTVYIGDMDGNSITIVKNGKVLDVIGSVQARPHNVALDPATGVLYFADPITPLYAGTEAIAAGANRAPGGMFKQVIRKK
jgi:DNA-binding beta-propeller fold protein YncE